MENSVEIKDQLIKNGFWNIVTSMINRFGGFIIIILLSRLLMPEGFGRYSLAITIALFFITISDMGINQALVRYVALGIDKKTNQSASYMNYFFKIKFFIALLLSLILFILAYPLSFFVFKDGNLFFPFLILSFYVLFTSLAGFFESLFYIKKNVRYISIKEFIFLVIKIAGILIISFFISSEYNLIGIFSLFLVISVLTLFFNFYFSKKSHPLLFKKANPIIDKKEISKFILFLGVQNIAATFIAMISIILLGIFLAEKYVGYYNAAWALVIGISALLFSFSFILLPVLTNADKQRFQLILKKIFRLFFILALPVSFGLSFLSRYFISVIYGNEYLSASIPLSILSFIIPCMIGVDLALSSFSAKNKLKKFTLWMSVFALIFFVLNYIFISIFLNYSEEIVIIGVSIANLIGWFFCFVFSIFLLKKELGITIFSMSTLKPFFSCLIMSAFIFFVTSKIQEINFLNGILIIFSSGLVYLISLFLIKGIEKEEIKEIVKILLKHDKNNL